MKRALLVQGNGRATAAPPELLARPLTARKALFVSHYLMGSTGTAAAIAAGYSAKAAKEIAWRLLHRDGDVMAAVCAAQNELRQKTEVTAESMMRQLAEDRALAIEAQQHSAAVKAS